MTHKGKILGIAGITLASFLFGCYPNGTNNSESNIRKNKSVQIEPQHETKKISGKIVDIDEDSFAIGYNWRGANFEFEHFRIKASDGKVYKIIFPGPSNYDVGDEVDFQYRTQQRINYQDLIKDYEETKGTIYHVFPMQEGYFDADGIVAR